MPPTLFKRAPDNDLAAIVQQYSSFQLVPQARQPGAGGWAEGGNEGDDSQDFCGGCSFMWRS